MSPATRYLQLTLSASCLTILSTVALAASSISLGPRPQYLVEQLPEGPLKSSLQSCDTSAIKPQPFSIGHRGAPLQFPEHTRESYMAAATMGAGVIECDATFTKDRELVCRHSQCDLHTTTNILTTPLVEKCRIPPDMNSETPFASVQCCTSDITLAEFRTLRGKMDAGNRQAPTLADYLDSTAAWRTDLYAQTGTLLTHAESIQLFDELGVDMTPELKEALVPLPFDGNYTREDQAEQLIQEYRDAGIDPSRVWPQSFEEQDISYWLTNAPDFADQVVYLDNRYRDDGFDPQQASSWKPDMASLAAQGIRYLAPPLWMLVALDSQQNMVPSAYAVSAKAAGLELIAWSLERSGPLHKNTDDWYYQSVTEALVNDGDTLSLLEVLAQDVGVSAVFSDWPATTTFYAHCRL